MSLISQKKGGKKQREILLTYTQDEGIIEELMSYCKNSFLFDKPLNIGLFPLENEPHIANWEQYQLEAKGSSLFEVLKQKFVPLNFPIQSSISQTNYYRNATLKGHSITSIKQATGLILEKPKGLTLTFKEGIVGKIPVIIVDADKDFNSLLQALIHKNEPVPIPSAMGASIIRGINNWHRLKSAITTQKKQFPNKSIKTIQQETIANKAIYQDNFILVSRKPYSNIFPSNFTKAAWLEASLSIRIQHEYAHYLTKRLFGVMRNNMHDELLADYLGLHAIKDKFEARLFLQFIGLENYPNYRVGGRLENYIGTPFLSGKGFLVLKDIMYDVANNVEKLDNLLINKVSELDLLGRFLILAQLGLLDLAALFKE